MLSNRSQNYFHPRQAFREGPVPLHFNFLGRVCDWLFSEHTSCSQTRVSGWSSPGTWEVVAGASSPMPDWPDIPAGGRHSISGARTGMFCPSLFYERNMATGCRTSSQFQPLLLVQLEVCRFRLIASSWVFLAWICFLVGGGTRSVASPAVSFFCLKIDSALGRGVGG